MSADEFLRNLTTERLVVSFEEIERVVDAEKLEVPRVGVTDNLLASMRTSTPGLLGFASFLQRHYEGETTPDFRMGVFVGALIMANTLRVTAEVDGFQSRMNNDD